MRHPVSPSVPVQKEIKNNFPTLLPLPHILSGWPRLGGDGEEKDDAEQGAGA
jgi:hypothetical protein